MSLYLGNNLISGTQIVTDKSERIGQIIPSTIPLADAGLHLLDGALINGNGSYSAFVDYIADLYDSGDYDDIFETEANWQQAVTDYGVCGKFVYDSVNNTVRLPKITGIVEGTTDLTALGDLVEAGLPNITGSIGYTVSWASNNPTTSGAISASKEGGCSLSSGSTESRQTINFNASNSNSMYGNSTTVQPQTIKVLYYIVIATSTKTDIEVDIDEIATDLNGKADADLSNVPTSKGILTESYINGASWYRVYSDGWCEQGGIVDSGWSSNEVSITFLKEFRDTAYNIQATTKNTAYCYSVNAIMTYSTTGVTVAQAQSTTGTRQPFNWYACGYIR